MDKKGIVVDETLWWILAVFVVIFIFIIITIFFTRGQSAIEFINNLFSGR